MRRFLYYIKWNKYHPETFAKFDVLRKNEGLSLDELMAKLEALRQKIVRHAMERTAFYKRFYGDVGFEIGDIGRDGWFERLPILKKKELREHFEEMTDQSLRPFRGISTTGGSTGTPTKTGSDRRVPEEIYSWRLQGWFGVHPWDDHAYVWRDTRQGTWAKFKNAALWWPTRHLKLDATLLTDEKIKAFLEECAKVRPTLLQGYVGAVCQVAEYVVGKYGPRSSILTSGQESASPLGGWRPKVVWTTSAPLSNVQRKLLEDAFGAPVCDQYGSCEIRWIAQQCPECKGLHVNVEHVNVEFVDEKGMPVPRGEYGKTLLTDLENFVFPLIRYENGDRGRWLMEPCACGRTLPCIDSVKGREVESFVLPSGKTINGEYLTTIFDATPDIARGFRVVQHRDLSITVEVVPNGRIEQSNNPNNRTILSVVRDFAHRMGDEVPVDCRFVDEIPHDRGKLRYVVREV